METLPIELRQDIASLLPPTIAKAYAIQYGYDLRFITRVLRSNRWMCIKKGITRSQYYALVERSVRIGGSWIQDLCWYGDLFYLEYVVKNLTKIKTMMPKVDDDIYLTTFASSLWRLPYSIYEYIKDELKSSWLTIIPFKRQSIYMSLVDSTRRPTIEWFVKNILTRDDGEVTAEVEFFIDNKHAFKINRKLLKRFKRFDEALYAYSTYGLINKSLDEINSGMYDRDDLMNLYVTITSQRNYRILCNMIEVYGLKDDVVRIINGDEVIYNQLLSPCDRFDIDFPKSDLYSKYTSQTLAYIQTLYDSKTILLRISSKAFYSSYEAFKVIHDLYKEHGIDIAESLSDCKALHEECADQKLYYKLNVYPTSTVGHEIKTIAVKDIVAELAAMEMYNNIEIQSTGQVLCYDHIISKASMEDME